MPSEKSRNQQEQQAAAASNDGDDKTHMDGETTLKDSVTSQGTGFRQTLKSVLMGFIGIQSRKEYEKDFEKGKPSDFIIMGIVITLLFILSIYWIVSSAVKDAGL